MPAKPRKLSPVEEELMPIVVAVITIQDKHRPGEPAHSIYDRVLCPVCEETTLMYTISLDGCIQAKCAAEHCGFEFKQ